MKTYQVPQTIKMKLESSVFQMEEKSGGDVPSSVSQRINKQFTI